MQTRLYWERNRQIERGLSTLELFLPEKLLLSQSPRSLDAILVHVCTYLATMQLYRTALGLLQLHQGNLDQIICSKDRLKPLLTILWLLRSTPLSLHPLLSSPLSLSPLSLLLFPGLSLPRPPRSRRHALCYPPCQKPSPSRN